MGDIRMKRFGKQSFQTQLIVCLLGCLLFSVVIIAACLGLNFREAERSNHSYIERLNEQWAMELEFMTAGIDKMRFLHLADTEAGRIIADEGETRSQEQYSENEAYMSRILDVLCTINSDVLRITVETGTGKVYGNYVEDSAASVALAKHHMLYEKRDYKNEMAVTDVYEGDINLVPYFLLTFCYPLYAVSEEESLGTIYIDMDFGAMKERFDAVDKQSGWSSYILNENGLIYGSDAALGASIGAEEKKKIEELAHSQTGAGSLTLGNRDYLIHVKYMEGLDWYLVQCVQKSIFMIDQMRGVYFMAVWVVIFLGGLICAGILLMKKISAPIGEMSRVMNQAATRENKELKYMEGWEEYPEEIREIVQGYNGMLDRIRKNIIQEYANELYQKKTELQMLQYQINPHFLYNTLNIMSAIARLNEIPYIPDISESLSKIFYYNVKGGQIVTLQEELDNLQNYLRIQMIRFPEKFTVEYQIEPELEKCRILKFLLQPLVENAIDHGIAEKTEKSLLVIEAKQTYKGELCIVIQDNGIGIPPDQLKKLQRILEQQEKGFPDEDRNRIGVRNVHMRVRNYYGDQYGISLESEEGRGTRVQITLPMEYGEMEVTADDGGHSSG